MSDYQSASREATRLVFNLLKAHHHFSRIKNAVGSNNAPGFLRIIRNYLPDTAPPFKPKSDLTTLLQGNACHEPQINIQQIGEHYITKIKAILQDLSRPVKMNCQDIWKIDVNWLKKKFKLVHPEVLVRGIGLDINPHTKTTPNPPVNRGPATDL